MPAYDTSAGILGNGWNGRVIQNNEVPDIGALINGSSLNAVRMYTVKRKPHSLRFPHLVVQNRQLQAIPFL